MNHLPQVPKNNIRVISKFFGKFRKIFGSQDAPSASTKPVAKTPVVPLDKFATGVVDTSGKFATCVIDIGNNLPLCR
jgi:hypothetical protein